jgi:hypothetical protein
MMKVCLALVVAMAAASDSEAPVISMSFPARMEMKKYSGVPSTYGLSSSTAYNTHASANANAYTSECDLMQMTGVKAAKSSPCKLPTVSAYDHVDEDITKDIKTNVTQYIASPAGKNPKFNGPKGSSWAYTGVLPPSVASTVTQQRGEYIFKFDVEDSNMNMAETVVFALLVRDEVKPWLDTNSGFTLEQNVERDATQNTWKVPEIGISYRDNADAGGVDDSFFLGKAPAKTFPTNNCWEGKVKFEVSDFASIFGEGNSNNVLSQEGVFKTSDNVAPSTKHDGVEHLSDENVNKHLGFKVPDSSKLEVECSYKHQFKIKNGKSAGNYFYDAGCECEDFHPHKKFLVRSKTIGNSQFTALKYGSGNCQWNYAKSENTNTAVGTKGDFSMRFFKTFDITYNAKDARNNEAKPIVKTYTVIDSTPPTLTVTLERNINQNKHQNYAGHCQYGYDATTGHCKDKNGDKTAHDFADVRRKDKDGSINTSKFGKNRADGKGVSTQNENLTPEQKTFRNLWIESTLASHVIQHSAGSLNDALALKELAESYECKDTCTEHPVKTARWFDISGMADNAFICQAGKLGEGKSFDDHNALAAGIEQQYSLEKPGKFVLMYMCEDESGKKATVDCRTVINEDSTKPVMRLMKDSHNHKGLNGKGFNYANSDWGVEKVYRTASQDGSYVDQGAECSDQVDGMMSQKIVVSGDIVNMAVPGTYTITFKCTDTSGNSADPLTRTVYVQDDTCPTCSQDAVNGQTTEVVHEASFPFNYDDFKATCSDDIYAAADVKISKTSGVVDVEAVGTYVLTYTMSDRENTNTGVNNDDHHGYNTDNNCDKCTGGKKPVNGYCGTPFRTVYVEDRLAPVIELHAALMAESSTNGWLALALASAAAGVALLGFSSRQAPATSVPV